MEAAASPAAPTCAGTACADLRAAATRLAAYAATRVAVVPALASHARRPVRGARATCGIGLKVAAILKDSVSPQVAFELWRSLRKSGPVMMNDLDLLARSVEAVGHRQEPPEDLAPLLAGDEDGAAIVFGHLN